MRKDAQAEYEGIEPAKRMPAPGTKSAQLMSALNEDPTRYRELYLRAGFDSDPFFRTTLRRCAKAGFIVRRLDTDGKELWSRKTTP